MKKQILILFVVVLSISYFSSHVTPANAKGIHWTPVRMETQEIAGEAQKEGIWGNIRHFTNRRITLTNGQQFDFSKNVLIDTENLEKDDRGNVRILLNLSGKAEAIFFNGIDMPDVIRRFQR